MRKILLIALILLPSLVKAQTVTITGTVKDPTGAPYQNGSGKAVLFPQNVNWTINQNNPIQSPVIISGLDSFGHFTISLTNTSLIDQQSLNPKWQFSFCSVAYSPQGNICFTMTPMTLTSDQDITATIQAQSALLPSTAGPGPASATVPCSTLSFTTTPVFASTVNACYEMTLTGNVTSSTVSGTPVNGNLLAFNFTQDATGGRTVNLPAGFVIPSTFSFDTAPNHVNYLAFKYDGTNWTFLTNSGGSGGSSAQPPAGSFQFNNSGVLGGSQFIYNPTDTSGANCNTQSCATITENVDGGLAIFSTDGTNSIGFVAQSNVAPPTTQAGAQSFVGTVVTHGPQAVSFSAQTEIGGTTTGLGSNGGSCFSSTVGSPSCGIAYRAFFGDASIDTNNGQDAVGFAALPSMVKSAGHNMHNVAGFLVQTPGNYSGSLVPVTESATNLWGLEIQDLQGIGTTQTAGLHIEAQTNPSSHSFAIKTETNAGPSVFTDSAFSNFFSTLTASPALSGNIRLASGDTACWRNAANNADTCITKSGAALGNAPADYFRVGSNFFEATLISPSGDTQVATTGIVRLAGPDSVCWRNFANSANLCLSKNASDNLIWPNNLSVGGTLLAGGGGGTATFPNNTGTIAELNLAQTFTASQSITNGNSIRWFSSNGTNYAGFGGGASTSNLIWLFPTTDSSGTQCLSSNGSLQLAWSACSAGSGTPGGANKNVQYNNASTFGGMSNVNYTVATGVFDFAQLANGNETITGHRFTDTSPTGNLFHFQNAALNSDLFKVDVLGTMTAVNVASTNPITVPNGGTGDATLGANQLLAGNGTSPVQSVAGSTTGTNPIVKLQPSSAANTALTLDTAASPSGDILDVNVNGTKTSWFDNAAFLHTPQATYTGTGPLTLSGTEGTCGSTSAGNDIICLGDAATHDAQLSVNGGTFKPMVQAANGSPTAHGLALWSVAFPQLNTTGAGTVGQPFLSGGASADGAFGALNLAGGSTIVTGITPPGNGGTGAASLAAANIVTVTGAITVGHCASYSATTVIQDSGGTCGGAGGAPPLHTITAATATNTIGNATFAQRWNWALAGSTVGFIFGESAASTGANNILLQSTTAATSTAVPFQADNNGIGYQINSTGMLRPVSTGAFAVRGAAHNLVVSQGSATEVSYIPPVTAGKVLIDNGPGNDPSFQDPIVSLAYVNIWTTQDVTTTRTSAAVRNPLFSQTGTLELTWAGITGSPATCTLQIQGVDSVGNALNNGSTFSVSPANGTTSQTFTAAATLQTAAQVKAIFACGTYPTGGTLTLDFTPIPNVNVTNTVAGNVTQFGGNAVVTGTGAGGSGIPRVTVSNDSNVLATQSGNWTARIVGNAGGVVDAAGQNAASPANELLVGCQFNTSPTTITSTNMSPAQCDNKGSLNSDIQTIAGTTVLTGNGTTGAGSVRVTVASDNTAFSVNATDVGNKADDGAAAGTDRLGTLPAIEQSQLPAAGTAGRNKALRTDLNGTLYGSVMPTNITTYSTNKIGLAPAASPTDIAVLPGNATNTVIVTRVQVSCTQTTAGIIDLQLIKRSTADTAGTSASMTIVPLDSGNAAAVSAPLTYTANPTTGTAVGNVDSVKLACLAPATAGAADIYVWKPGMGQSIVLRGTAQQLAVNLNGVTLTGGSVNITFSWIETTGL